MVNADFHMHTSFSDDSITLPEDMIDMAIKKGLRRICITDHQDVDYPDDEMDFTFDTIEYFKVLEELQKKYKSKIDIRIGVELGLQPHLNACYKEYTSKYPFDFVIGSMHTINGMDPYRPSFFSEKSDEECYRNTFIDTINCIHTIEDFDILGHIDYVVRYGKHKAKEYSYTKFADYIDEILQLIIKKGKGIEVNTSGLRYGLGFCHPHTDIIKRYKELGGEIITIGADGHIPEHIAYEFDFVKTLLKECGFKYYTEFKERSPVFKQLP